MMKQLFHRVNLQVTYYGPMQHFSTDNPYIIKIEAATMQAKTGLLLAKTVAVKDLFHIAGQPTTAGNPDWLNSHPLPQKTSPVILSLEQEGACIVGKTITDELAYSLNGQNIHYGTPINGCNPQLLPGGSSSGSAIAVANGSADIGLGTDTGGSIRIPASYNALFGFRPSHGRVSVQNMVELAPSFDTVGWMTRDFATLSKVAEVLLNIKQHVSSHIHFKIGLSEELNACCEQQTEITQILEKLIKSNTNTAIVNVSEVLNFSVLKSASDTFRILQGAEIWQTHGQWIKQNQPNFAPDIAQRFAWCQTITPQQVQHAKVEREAFVKKVNKLFEHLDFIIVPTTPGRPPNLNATESDLTDYRNSLLSLTCIAGLAGLPQLHIPLITAPDYPLGLSIVGKKYDDQGVFNLGHHFMELLA